MPFGLSLLKPNDWAQGERFQLHWDRSIGRSSLLRRVRFKLMYADKKFSLGTPGRLGQPHAVLGPNHARAMSISTPNPETRAFGPKARSPDPITLSQLCRL